MRNNETASQRCMQAKGGPFALPPTTYSTVDYAMDLLHAERDFVATEKMKQEGRNLAIQALYDDEEPASLLTYRRQHLPVDEHRETTPGHLPAEAIQVRAARRARCLCSI